MTYYDLVQALKLDNKVIAITRTNNNENITPFKKGCILKAFNEVINVEKLVLSVDAISCSGAGTGMGFCDGLPNIPGGFGNFLCKGAGKGFPIGERIKSSPEIGEEMLLGQPQNVLNEFSTIELKQFEENDKCDLVTIISTCDQMAALVHLFNYRKSEYDNVIMPMVSGCASIFRIPFGELKVKHPRAVIGNADIFSRPHLNKDTYFFTVSRQDFLNMIEDAGESFLIAPIWNGIKARL